jgi:hypothetical protein
MKTLIDRTELVLLAMTIGVSAAQAPEVESLQQK